MMYQTFHIPKKFYNSMRIVSGADSILLNKSFDIGCRLMCGLESAYQREKNEVALNIKMKTDSKFLNISNGKYKEFYSTNNDENKSIISSIDCLIEKLKIIKSNEIIENEKKGKRNEEEEFNETKISKRLLINYNLCEKKTPQDGDAWLYMSPEELDKEMELRVKSVKLNTQNKESNIENKSEDVFKKSFQMTEEKNLSNNSNSDSMKSTNKNNKKEINESTTKLNQNQNNNNNFEIDTNQLQNMLDGMKLFMGSKSDIDGVDSKSKSKISASSRLNNSINAVSKTTLNTTSDTTSNTTSNTSLNNILDSNVNKNPKAVIDVNQKICFQNLNPFLSFLQQSLNYFFLP